MHLLLIFFGLIVLPEKVWSDERSLQKLILSEIEKELSKQFNISEDWFSNKTPKIQREKKQKKKAKKKIQNGDWMASANQSNNDWYDKKSKDINQWQNYRLKTLNRWRKVKQKYRKNIAVYKRNAVALPVESIKKQENKNHQKYLSSKRRNVISSAFYRRSLDQGNRPTCVAFAAVRAIEILMAREDRYQNLSEQFFYYLSKPTCQKSPCSIPGSWATKGLQASKEQGIPSEANCPYGKQNKPGNETQIPLASSCYSPVIKLKNYYKISTIDALVKALDQNDPVLAGMRLTENFYQNRGVVSYSHQMKKGRDSHADGHAMLFVGYYKLPKELHLEQGRYCFLVTNSWGEGWGKGGHACLTEKWFAEQRYRVSMLAINKI